jgi:type IV secretory pathway TrbD component
MPDKPQQKQRTNRVFKSLHKPLTFTYLGVERTLFYFVCVGAVGAFNLFDSILAGIAVFIGGFAFGHWATNTDPAFLRILARSERYELRYDAAKQQVPRVEVQSCCVSIRSSSVERECGAERPHQSLRLLE